MSRLTDLLGKSLPSQTANYNENSDFDFDTDDFGFEEDVDNTDLSTGGYRDGIDQSRKVNRAGYANDSNKGYGLTGDARDANYSFRGAEDRDDQEGYGLRGGAADAKYSYKGRPKTNAQYGYGLTGDAADANYSVGATGYSESDDDDFDFDFNENEFDDFDDMDMDFDEMEFDDDDLDGKFDEFGDTLGGEQYDGFEDGDEDDLGTPIDDDLDDEDDLGGVGLDDLEDIDFSDDDLADISDDDLDALAADIEDDELNDLIGDECGDECGTECNMSMEAEERADDIFAAAGTPMLIESVLSADEKRELVNDNRELSILVNDGLMFESDIEDLRLGFGNDEEMFEAMYNGPTKVKWSVETIKARLFGTAIFACATAARDKDLLKYRKLRKMARVYKAKLRKRYKAPAMQRMRVLFKRLKMSKSKTANKASKVIK